ncbi:MAG: DUF839 domain-containing protein [Phycisphaerales bacterium]
MRQVSTSAALVAAIAGVASAQNIGPSTTTAPYVVPSGSQAGLVSTTSIFTVGDSIGGYRMVGIPDGLGAMANPAGGSFSLFMNHELGATAGIARAHGSTGSFVSRWEIGNDLTVLSGRDHNTSASDVFTWNGTSFVAGTTQYSRLCSADLPAASAFFNPASGLGTTARIFMNGEETGAEGRAFGHIVSGPNTNQSYQLPYLGRFSWENSVTSPFAQDKTIVIGLDDSSPGQVYAYVGDKTNTGNDIERAGLHNGSLYGIRTSFPTEVGAINGTFSMEPVGMGHTQTGAQLQAGSVAGGVTEFLRPEDGHWDPRNPNDFYFVTTGNGFGNDNSRLYRLRFNDITNPEAGGEITNLLDGTEGHETLDNMTIDSHGRILIQEDPGSASRLAKIWLYDIDTGGYTEIAEHSADFFQTGAANFLTTNEESSGIIDAKDILGDGWFLLDVQAHYGIPGELVEGGQMVAMYVDPRIVPAPGALALVGLGGLLAGRRRR